jgi:hypothetical protein
MTTQPEDDRARRRRAAVWVVVPLALLVGINAVVLVAANRGDDEPSGAARTEPTPAAASPTPAAPERGRTLRATGDGVVDGPYAGGTSADASEPRDGGNGSGVLAGGSGPGGSGSQVVDGGDSGDASRPHGAGLVLSSSVDGVLLPGQRRTLTLTIRNGHPWPVYLLRTDLRPEQPEDAPGCDPSWVTVERYRYTGDGDRVLVGARSTATVELDIELVNLADVNQDACKGVAFPLTLSATAAEWTG